MLRSLRLASALALLGCNPAAEPAAAPPEAAPEGHDPHGAHHASAHMPERFDNAESWAKRFDAPERDAWQRPDAVIAALALPANAQVADVGSGTGYFAVRLARALPGGKVIGYDIEADMVRYLNERASKEGLGNLSSALMPADRAEIAPDTDLVLIVDTWHHISNRTAWLETLKPKLAAGGRVAVIDFTLETDKGPPVAHRLSPAAVASEFEAAGFSAVADPAYEGLLPDQYLLVFTVK